MAIKPIEILINAKDEASAVFGRLQTKIAAVGVAVAGYFGVKTFSSAVQSAAEFEAAMSRVKAATGATGEEFAALEKAAADAGANTTFTAKDAAGALENLAKAGLDSTQAVQALNPVLHMAAAADVELATAAEYVTKAVMGMGLSFDDAGRVADVLAEGANASNTSVSGLSEALSYAAPIAQTVGLSLEETTAIMGKLADAGIDASRAGTGLANILAQFSDPASRFRKSLGEIGITTNDFTEALRQLEASGEKGGAAIRAVGLNAGPALQSLLNQGMGAVDALAEKLRNAEGSAAAAAKVMQDNLQGSIKGMGSAWEAVQNALAAPVLPVLTDGINQLANAFRASVADGTIDRFGQIIKTAFESAVKGLREFLASFDVQAVTTKLTSMAASAGEAFGRLSEYAKTAGGIVQTTWGVMTAGANTVMAVIYKVAEAFAGVASNVQSGIALILDGLAKVTFGGISASFKAAADEIRLSAEATWAASEAFAEKSRQALESAADGAETAAAGWAKLTDAAEPAAQAVEKLQERSAQLTDTTDALASSAERAATKMQALGQQTQDASDAVERAKAGIASTSEAFELLGITSSEALQNTAIQARAAYEIVRDSGTASARDIQAAFQKSAAAAIDAADGVAPAWVRAQAAAHGYIVEVDKSGKSVLRLKTEILATGKETERLRTHWQGVTQQIESAADAAKRLKKEAAEAAEAAANADRERRRQDGIAGKASELDVYKDAIAQGLSKKQAEEITRQFFSNGQRVGWDGGLTTTSNAIANLGKSWDVLVQEAIQKAALENIKSGQPQTPQAPQQPAPFAPSQPAQPAPATKQGGLAAAGVATGITINVSGITDPVKLARMLEPELAKLTRLAR